MCDSLSRVVSASFFVSNLNPNLSHVIFSGSFSFLFISAPATHWKDCSESTEAKSFAEGHGSYGISIARIARIARKLCQEEHRVFSLCCVVFVNLAR